jgi:metal-responsive CopG/Arc/MetJ family transcriptional regulator
MSTSAKVAFSVDRRLLDRVERIRAKTGESRSAVIARALALVTKAAARDEQIGRYVAAYREQPESADDEQVARRTARRSLTHLSWEE